MSEAGPLPAHTWAVVPALNEQRTLAGVLAAIRDAGMRSVLVDDGSTDATTEIGRTLSDLYVRHEHRRGYGAALAAGMRAVIRQPGVSWVVTLDADGQLDPHDAATAVRAASRAGAAVFIGLRPRAPRLLERLSARLFRRCFGIDDPFCGMKGFRADVVERYLDYAGRHVNLALAVKAVRSGERLHQSPVSVRSRQAGDSRFYSARGQLRLAGAIVGALMVGFGG